MKKRSKAPSPEPAPPPNEPIPAPVPAPPPPSDPEDTITTAEFRALAAEVHAAAADALEIKKWAQAVTPILNAHTEQLAKMPDLVRAVQGELLVKNAPMLADAGSKLKDIHDYAAAAWTVIREAFPEIVKKKDL